MRDVEVGVCDGQGCERLHQRQGSSAPPTTSPRAEWCGARPSSPLVKEASSGPERRSQGPLLGREKVLFICSETCQYCTSQFGFSAIKNATSYSNASYSASECEPRCSGALEVTGRVSQHCGSSYEPTVSGASISKRKGCPRHCWDESHCACSIFCDTTTGQGKFSNVISPPVRQRAHTHHSANVTADFFQGQHPREANRCYNESEASGEPAGPSVYTVSTASSPPPPETLEHSFSTNQINFASANLPLPSTSSLFGSVEGLQPVALGVTHHTEGLQTAVFEEASYVRRSDFLSSIGRFGTDLAGGNSLSTSQGGHQGSTFESEVSTQITTLIFTSLFTRLTGNSCSSVSTRKCTSTLFFHSGCP